MRGTVAFNRRLSPAYFHLGIAVSGFPVTFRAGQFVMVRPPWVGDPFLPRAMSIYRVSAVPPSGDMGDELESVVEILYKVLGKGTQCLARLEPGQEVEVLGPLGNAFALPEPMGLAVLVAGGIGVPPIAALAREFRISNFEFRNVEVFLGGKTHEDILCVKDFEEAGATVHITTEDASLGTRGLITDILRPFLVTHHAPRAEPRDEASRLTMYTCGPPGMLAAVARLAEEYGFPCQASVEANMACGFGACMGCPVEVKAEGPGRHYKLVCKDGPVFDSREIRW